MSYDREKAVAYAHKWAFSRNPNYYSFDEIGGDCTNFISQCLYAGSGVMNHTPETGWYYHSLQNRSPAWTSVVSLHKFLTGNHGPGPYGRELPLEAAQPGDIIQLSFQPNHYSHSLLVTQTGPVPTPYNILIATHTFDADNRPLASYSYVTCRLIHIEGVNS